MKLITLFLLVGMLAVSGCSKQNKNEPYSPELVKKAESGDMDAQFKLGRCYYQGLGATKDYKEAVKWFTKAAEHGHRDAKFNLGQCYYRGEGVTKNKKEAVKWYTKAAKQGDERAKKALEMLKSK